MEKLLFGIQTFSKVRKNNYIYMKQQNYFMPKLENLRVGEDLVSGVDVEKIRLEAILFQTDYLTIDKV